MKKNVKVFLASGLLEEYLMGTCSSDKVEKVEYYLANFPEVKAEHARLQEQIQSSLDKLEKDAPDGLKEAIISCLEDDSKYKIKSVYSRRKKQAYRSFTPWAAAVVGIVSSFVFFNQKERISEKNMEMHAELYMVQHQLQERKAEITNLEDELALSGHNKTERLLLNGNERSPDFSSTAFWNDVAGKAIIYVNDIGTLDKQHCYQVWADVDGIMVNAGIIPSKKGCIKIDYQSNATSLNITIEPKGGSEHPNVKNLVSSQKLIKI